MFTQYLVVLEQKCQLPIPHNFGSRVPSLSTEIGISHWPLWKITKLSFYTVPGGPRAKVSITDPPQFWVKGSIVVDGNQNFSSVIMKNHKIGVFTQSLVVLEQKCQLQTPHKFGSMVPLLSMEIEISPSAIMKNHKIGFCMFPVGPRAKVSITNLPQVWVKGSIIVEGNWNFTLGHYEKSQNWGLNAPCWS